MVTVLQLKRQIVLESCYDSKLNYFMTGAGDNYQSQLFATNVCRIYHENIVSASGSALSAG